MELSEKALDFQQRLKRRIEIRKIEPKLQRGREINKRKMAGNARIKTRSLRAAKNRLVQKLSGGKNYSSLSTSQKISVDRRLESKRGAIQAIAKRLFSSTRKKEQERLARARKYVHEDFESLINIVNMGLLEGKNDPAIFKAVFLAGGPGSGKSFTAGKIAFKSMGFKEVNVDTFFEHAMKKAGLSLKPESIYSDKGQAIRDRSKNVKINYEDTLISGRLGLVLDGTGKDLSKMREYKLKLESLGYETAMVFVNTDLETSKKRNRSRERTILDVEVENMWKEVQKNLGEFEHMFGNRFFIVDNSENVNTEHQTLKLFKTIQKWSRTPVNNPAARAWRESQ